jgi:hypothetical protein
MAPALRRGLIAALVAVVVLVGCGLGLWALWRAAQSHSTAEECTVGDYALDPSQASVASTMVGVVLKRDLPERAAVLALAAALQESKLANLGPGEGDRDSVGVLQQRPSQGWGTPTQLQDVHFATGAFLDAMVKVDGWQSLPLADAIQKVQISVDGSFYARHEGEAQALSDALTGHAPGSLTCTFPKPSQVATSAQVASLVLADLPVNRPAAGGDGVTVTVRGASWATTAWFVANADRLGIDSVAYSGREWTREHGWRENSAASARAVVATLHH